MHIPNVQLILKFLDTLILKKSQNLHNSTQIGKKEKARRKR